MVALFDFHWIEDVVINPAAEMMDIHIEVSNVIHTFKIGGGLCAFAVRTEDYCTLEQL